MDVKSALKTINHNFLRFRYFIADKESEFYEREVNNAHSRYMQEPSQINAFFYKTVAKAFISSCNNYEKVHRELRTFQATLKSATPPLKL